MSEAAPPVLAVEGLRTRFGAVRAVDGVSFAVARGETLCIVGESGSGKSATALSIMGLIPSGAGIVEGGSILLAGHGELRGLPDAAMADIRGRAMGMIFQEPMTALNPVFRVGAQIAEVMRRHEDVARSAARDRAVELLRLVGVPSPQSRAQDFPHQLSGGMRQRVMIAMAIAYDPALILADEPTTALDVTIQAQILALIDGLKERLGSGIVFITHDLRVVAQIAQQVCVMYAGVVVERAATRALLREPLHPYTKGLMASVPGTRPRGALRRLPAIAGTVPNLARLPVGCRFRNRCPSAFARCAEAEPPLAPPVGGDPDRLVRCWLHAA
ncbi:ABC transporter ATP-binding protein [Plastoroseomonas arctica]|uniref:ABC transporter ATP-binding protein n=1 Tax=Plastoroseomonas arctica TaxID=1509237 RepID=A0AAF1KU51_9PROT|nr:ABC transporter ATP-binding protein [Plastoroseomonas arctica]MBR0655497.1 ABC transporter ATP-binding protein [Plastoroseomonas arctica]